MGTDTVGIILNEAAVKKLSFPHDPVNEKLSYNLGEDENREEYTVIGVVKDFVVHSLKESIRPAALVLLKRHPADYLSVKLSSGNILSSIEYLSSVWKEFGQIKPMEYSFFDEQFDELYRSDIQTGKVFTIFSLLAIVIACLGLFGLTAFTAEQRTKEIGVRKVLGANIPGIVSMLSKEFLILVALANLIAWPAAYYIMNHWLEAFAYKAEIGIEVFLLASLAVLIIALITISFQAIKAARANPVEALRHE
jgi:putative ABC transport system permease protein